MPMKVNNSGPMISGCMHNLPQCISHSGWVPDPADGRTVWLGPTQLRPLTVSCNLQVAATVLMLEAV